MKSKIINVILILLCGLCIWLYLFPKENIEIKYIDSNELTVTFENDDIVSIKGINHRGYSTEAPENTLAAFKLSKAYGFTYVETDVSFTLDDVPVLLHDQTINRTSNGTGRISKMTYKQVLQYDFGSWKGKQFKGEKIPTLEEFLRLCKDIGLKPYIEFKKGATKSQILSALEIIKKMDMVDQVTYISFDTLICKWIAEKEPYARIGVLAQKNYSSTIAFIKKISTKDNYVFADIKSIDAKTISKFQKAEIPVEVWTINNKTTIQELNSYISGVTSDIIDAEMIR